MSKDIDLLPCPLCNGNGTGVNDYSAVLCSKCGYIVTLDTWNTRPTEPQQVITGKNRFGLDMSYYSKELHSLLNTLPNRTPYEMYRYFECLRDTLPAPKHVNKVSEWVSVDKEPETPKGFSKYSQIPIWILKSDNTVIEGDYSVNSGEYIDDFMEDVDDAIGWQYRLPPSPPQSTERKEGE